MPGGDGCRLRLSLANPQVVRLADGIQWTQLTGQTALQHRRAAPKHIERGVQSVLNGVTCASRYVLRSLPPAKVPLLLSHLRSSSCRLATARVWLHSSTPFLQWGRNRTNRATIPLPEHCLLQGLAGKLTVVWLLSPSWTFVIFNISPAQQAHHYHHHHHQP